MIRCTKIYINTNLFYLINIFNSFKCFRPVRLKLPNTP